MYQPGRTVGRAWACTARRSAIPSLTAPSPTCRRLFSSRPQCRNARRVQAMGLIRLLRGPSSRPWDIGAGVVGLGSRLGYGTLRAYRTCALAAVIPGQRCGGWNGLIVGPTVKKPRYVGFDSAPIWPLSSKCIRTRVPNIGPYRQVGTVGTGRYIHTAMEAKKCRRDPRRFPRRRTAQSEERKPWASLSLTSIHLLLPHFHAFLGFIRCLTGRDDYS